MHGGWSRSFAHHRRCNVRTAPDLEALQWRRAHSQSPWPPEYLHNVEFEPDLEGPRSSYLLSCRDMVGLLISSLLDCLNLAKASQALHESLYDEHDRVQLRLMVRHCSGDRNPSFVVVVAQHWSRSRILEVRSLDLCNQVALCNRFDGVPGGVYDVSFCMSHTKWPMFYSANVMIALWHVHSGMLPVAAVERC